MDHRRAGAVRRVDVNAGADQGAQHFNSVLALRHKHIVTRRAQVGIAQCTHVNSTRQHAAENAATLAGRHDKFVGGETVNWNTGVEQQDYESIVLLTQRAGKHRSIGAISDVQSGAARNEQSERVELTPLNGNNARVLSIAMHSVDVCAGVEQHRHDLYATTAGGREQRWRRAMHDTRGNQRRDCCNVVVGDRSAKALNHDSVGVISHSFSDECVGC